MYSDCNSHLKNNLQEFFLEHVSSLLRMTRSTARAAEYLESI